MVLGRFIRLFCIITYFTFVITYQGLPTLPGENPVEANTAITANGGSMYALDNERNVGYVKASIVQQLEDVSRVQCSLQCKTIEGCKHVVVDEEKKRCKLLREIVSLNGRNPEDEREDGEEIFSLVGESGLYQGSFYFLKSCLFKVSFPILY